MSKANMVLATLEVQLKEGEEEPTPHLDEGASPFFPLSISVVLILSRML
jgi:hypothetical protein